MCRCNANILLFAFTKAEQFSMVTRVDIVVVMLTHPLFNKHKDIERFSGVVRT